MQSTLVSLGVSGHRLRLFNVGGLNRMLDMGEAVDPDSYPLCYYYPGIGTTGQIFDLTCTQILQTRYVIIQVTHFRIGVTQLKS